MTIKLPETVKLILNTLNEFGYTSYIVGGCVRDSVLGIVPHDWDITTDATPKQIKEVFNKIKKQHRFTVIPTGEKYGTVTVHRYSTKENYEVTTFRYDQEYSDGRRPDNVVFGKSITDDLERRDFTINAMAYNELVGLVDPFNGMYDIKRKVIKCVGYPEDRFNEDALRILRALRFSARLGFNIESITANTMYSLKENVILKVSKERIHDELIKILEHSNNIDIGDYDPIVYIFQEIFEIKNLSPSTISSILKSNDPVSIKIYKLICNKPLYEMEIWLRKYKFCNKAVKQILNFKLLSNSDENICKLNNNITPLDINKYYLTKFPYGDVELYIKMLGYKDNDKIFTSLIYAENSPHKINQLAINGDDLKAIGIKDGKLIGDILNQCLSLVIDNPEKNNKDYLLKLFM